MTDLTKLADALENIAHMEYPSGHHDGNNLREAAALLRAAGAADVGGLMALHDAAAEARRVLVRGGDVPQDEADRSRQSRAALESALRVALAQRDGYVIDLLVAAGHVTAEKVAQAREIAAAQAGAQEPKP